MKKLLYLILCVFTWSCSDFLTQEPETFATNLNSWKSEQEVESVVNGMHSMFRATIGNFVQNYRDRGSLLDYNAMTAWKKSCNNDLSSVPASSPTLSWQNEYQLVAQCNLIIDNIYRASLPQDRHNFYLGQALTVRAYVYFHIIRIWGDAPVIVSIDDLGEKGRTPWREIAGFIITDLKKAIELLPTANEQTDAQGKPIVSRQIPSKGMAQAILAHVYAWCAGYGNEPTLYTEGIKAADKVIKDPSYELAANPEEVCTKVLHKNSREGILEISYDEKLGESKSSGSYMAGAVQGWPLVKNIAINGRRNFRINFNTVYNLYNDPKDLRRQAYFYRLDSTAKLPTATTQNGAYVIKWRYPVLHESGNQKGRLKTYDVNEIIIRLADIILLRAEMKAKAGDTEGAISDLNLIRKRAGVTGYTTEEGDLKEAIQRERDKELLFESYGQHYYDCMRNHTYNTLKGSFKTVSDQDVQNGILFWPVGISAFQNNPQMTQTLAWPQYKL